MAENSNIIGALLLAFVLVVVGIAFLSTSADTVSQLTDVYPITNSSFTALNNTFVVFDSTAVNVTGISAVRNNVSTTLTNGLNYTYTDPSYINDGAARALTNLIPLFFALAIALGVFGYIRFKDLGAS